MKYLPITFLLIFLSTSFYSSGQSVRDSTDIIKSYKENIVAGRVIKYIGAGLMITGVATAIITFPFLVSDVNQETDAGTIMEVAVITTLIAIPITFIGKHIQKTNERKLAIYYRLGLQTMSNTPIIGIKYRF